MPQSVKTTTRRCPFCAELIQAAAVKCRFCSEFLVSRGHPSVKERPLDDEYDNEVDEPDYEEEFDEEEEIDEVDEEDEEEVDEDEENEEVEEEILYRGSPSVFASKRVYLRAALIFGVAVVLYHLRLEYYFRSLVAGKIEITRDNYIMLHSYRMLGVLVLGLAGVIYFLSKIIKLKCICYEVTADRIEWSRGVFSRKIDNVDMFRVEDLRLHRSATDCMLGIGTVRVYTRDKTDNKFDFYKVRRPRNLYNIIKKASLNADARQNVVHLE